MYTDDYFVFGSREFVVAETSGFSVDAESVMGVDAIDTQKTLSGCDIDIIGLANCTTAVHTIGLSETIFLKMLFATLVMMSSDLVVGDSVSVKALRSLASRAIHCADVVQVMAPLLVRLLSEPARLSRKRW